MQNKAIFGIIGVLVIAAGGYYAWQSGMLGGQGPTPATPAPVEDTRLGYASSTLGVSLKYPRDFTVDSTYAYTGFPKKPILGVKFTIPGSMSTGTNL